MTTTAAEALADVRPQVGPDRLLADLVPPPHFAAATFDTYLANPDHPSQQLALDRLREVATTVERGPAKGLPGLLRRRQAPPAVYLDGGFGVGKTHLLAALAHAVGLDHVAFGTFVEYTNLVGALGFAQTVAALGQRRLVCIDEFELDDPGDTVLMSRLLRELADQGVALAATSNTLPESLGEGRFAAEDFLREIQALAGRFEVLRVDGDDYRHRAVVTEHLVVPDVQARDLAVRLRANGARAVTLDSLDDLLEHLRTVHPSRYGALLDGIDAVGVTGVHQVSDQSAALRLVVLVDRLYDRDVAVVLGGEPGTALFTETMLRGGYRKKYYRTLSRLGALVQQGTELAHAG